MIRLFLAMLRVRRGPALTVMILCAVATAGATAGPLYHSAAGTAATTVEAQSALPGEQAIVRTQLVSKRPQRPGQPANLSEQPRRVLPYLPGFETISGFQVSGRAASWLPPEPVEETEGPGFADDGPTDPPLPADDTPAPEQPVPMALAALVYRTEVCQQVIIVRGRCFTGDREIIISAALAAVLKVKPGELLRFQAGDGVPTSFQAQGGPTSFTIAGTYDVRDRNAAYWAGRSFAASADDPQRADALFGTLNSVVATPFESGFHAIDLIANRAAYDDLDALETVIAEEESLAEQGEYGFDTGLRALVDRIEASQQVLTQGVRVAAIPLVLLAWYVLYLAVVNSALRRRTELGLTGLRGVPGAARWWLGAAEYIFPALVGAPLGFGLGYLLVAVLSSRSLPGAPPVEVTLESLLYALVAVGGAVSVGVFAQWRATSAPVASLLRRTPMRRATGLVRIGELLVVVLTLAAGYQIYSGGGTGSGLALLTPMFVALTAGLLATRVAGLLAERAGRRALRHGRLSRALFAFSLSRQSSQSQLLGLLVILFTVVGFAISANDVAADARVARASTELGAARVLSIRDLPGQELLSAVRKVDPAGSYAMAVVRGLDDEEPFLAIDSTRLAKVAHWDAKAAAVTADQVAHALRPARPGAAQVLGKAVTLRATVGEQQAGLRASLLLIDPLGRPARADLGELTAGQKTYLAPTPQCAEQACRLVGLEVPTDSSPGPYQIDLTLHELRAVDPDSVLIDAAGFTGAGWRVDDRADRNPVKLATSAAGVRLSYTGVSAPETRLLRVLTPLPLPVVTTSEPRPKLRTGGAQIAVVQAGTAALLPRLGTEGGLVDLEYFNLVDQSPGQAREPQVWLSASAPADVADRLRKAGLVIVGDQTIGAAIGLADEKGPALALRFYLLVALAAVLLGVGGMAVLANADRQEQTTMLRALRMQGLPTGVAWRQGLGGYAALITTAAIVGTAAAAFAWWFARDVVPLFADLGRTEYAPAWPALPLLGLVVLAAAAVLAVTGVVASMALRRAVEGRAR